VGTDAVSVTQRWSCAVGGESVEVTVVDTFRAAPHSITVDTVITADKVLPFTVQLNTALALRPPPRGAGLAAEQNGFWLPFGKGCVMVRAAGGG
jgi:hypothetical protein